MDFTEIASVTSLADLSIGQDVDGDAVISWTSGDPEISNVCIELRGVDPSEVTADLFLFA